MVQAVKEYVFSIMIVSISCAALNILTPEGSGTSKYVHFIAALVVSTVLLSPIQSLVGVLPDIFDKGYSIPAYAEKNSEYLYTDTIISETIENIKNTLASQLYNRFGYEACDLIIECDTSDSKNVAINEVTVIYEKDNRFLFSDTENYIKELLGCECEVRCIEDERE